VDNGSNLRDIVLHEEGEIGVKSEDLPAPVLYMQASRRKVSIHLYQQKQNERDDFTARLIPYFAFANRGESDMLIWTQVK
jgi:DUF1680 family protein